MSEHSHNHETHSHDPHVHNAHGTETKFILSLSLTGLILLAEIVGGMWTGSLALLSDAAHVFLDMLALALSFIALRLAARPANDSHTFGFHRMQVLAALINGATLLFIAFEIFHEAWNRFRNPEPVLAGPMLIVAVIGLVVNFIVAFTLHEHDHDDLNVRSAFLHVLGDALASVGVIGAGVIMLYTDWVWVDPLVSVLIAVIILSSSGRVLRQAVHILAEGMPEGMTASEVAAAMGEVPGVEGIHDLHVWTVSPGYVALSAHVVTADQSLQATDEMMAAIKHILSERFGIEHTTIQFECAACGQGTAVFVPAV